MARIRPVPEPSLPWNEKNGASERSLPYISKQLHEEIRSLTERQWRVRLSKITKKRLARAVGDDPRVTIVCKGQPRVEIFVMELEENQAAIKLALPLRGPEEAVQDALLRLFHSKRVESRFYPEHGAITAWIVLPSAPAVVQVPFPGPDGRRVMLTTREEAERQSFPAA